jgi:glyoxylase-like metal-dependent hydrolase (beta-lactamase superfamily II)
MVPHLHPLGPHVTVVGGAEGGKYPDGNSVLVRGTESSVMIDPALGVRSSSVPFEVDRVLLTHTHEDHVAGVSAVRFGEISVHGLDLAALKSVEGLMDLYGLPTEDRPAMTQMVTERFHFEGWPDATALDDGDAIDLGGGVVVRLVHAPGHTGGHSVYVVDSPIDRERVVVTGDIDLSSFGPYYGDAVSSLDQFESTLGNVREIEAAHYVTFHHKGVVDGHAAFVAAIDAYLAVIARREHHLLHLLGERRTFDELVDEGIIYRPGTRPPLFGTGVERRSIGQHLDRLLADGAASTDGHHYWRT